MRHEDVDDLTLARYLSDELSPAEAAFVERWLAADPTRAQRVALLRAAWRRPAPREFDPDDAVWARLAAQLELPLPGPVLVRDPAPWPWQRLWELLAVPRVRRLVAAAVAVLCVGGALAVFQLRRGAAPIPMEEVVTTRGQRATVVLPDGSQAILAAESRLRYPASVRHWRRSQAARELFLEGQAYFEVQHDSTRSFLVHTSTGLVEDLGTEFVVTAYPETRATVVAVVSGLVALYRAPADSIEGGPAEARSESAGTAEPEAVTHAVAGSGDDQGRPLLTLRRGDVARLDASGTATVTRDVNLAPYVAWTEWNLVFDATPMHEVAATLARWYDLDITFADNMLADRRLTASFRYESLSEVVELIARSLDAQVERDGRSVVLSADPPAAR